LLKNWRYSKNEIWCSRFGGGILSLLYTLFFLKLNSYTNESALLDWPTNKKAAAAVVKGINK
jgi:hypothetical protein